MDKKQLLELIEEGLTLEEIATKIKSTKTKVNLFCRKNNINLYFKNKFCSECKEIKSTSEFLIVEKNNKEIFYYYCNDCIKKRSRKKDKNCKQIAVNYKGGKCEICGYNTSLKALEFHHKDPEQKEFSISKYRYIKIIDGDFKQELDKCLLLCANCHREEHQRLYLEKINKQKNIDIQTNENSTDEIKYCKACDTNKSIKEFYLCNNKRKGIKEHFSYCKSCLIQKTIDIQKQVKKEAVEYKGNKCHCCGYNKENAALEFHHLDPTKKDFSIASINKSIGHITDKVKDELDKCVLLCANCHREVHFGLIDNSQLILTNNTTEENKDFTFKTKVVKIEKPNSEQKVTFVRIEFANCETCNKVFSKQKYIKKKYCSSKCYSKAIQKVNWDKVNLKELWPKNSMLSIAKSLGVSINSVKKRLIKEGLK